MYSELRKQAQASGMDIAPDRGRLSSVPYLTRHHSWVPGHLPWQDARNIFLRVEKISKKRSLAKPGSDPLNKADLKYLGRYVGRGS
ncbi:uncharacterized protein PADG_07997 [Paracoccidioides brasiliensis Pb18]|uniref:Uncharacterized protein n=1 Tax=Paracoccidioides brasiliensis (strain Pb18) TaxID=502780 RepID=C1GKZ0_PARBD|nr:uncharacterized protein PADG_07997 [Paracoccidioides brasiliensis Pb18]EEH43177.2 hypothetical protein PADG_07997 [Paracoccidioides brasiliensis Pb18]